MNLKHDCANFLLNSLDKHTAKQAAQPLSITNRTSFPTSQVAPDCNVYSTDFKNTFEHKVLLRLMTLAATLPKAHPKFNTIPIFTYHPHRRLYNLIVYLRRAKVKPGVKILAFADEIVLICNLKEIEQTLRKVPEWF